ncbi:fatty-acyl-CoA synthase [Murinocardiopsis flavida]|uniref:Fatty-acyl-CoA synthase n=1 Tax=Murinocardiopsis flavida TaxID=645275 RepID=A0A2P8DH83_9ACTN|nr:AMP-binding protein [Murinocardiopsis flavida]PSK96582.1 fatty-acyl-CoA synthase [Murinocardiopsis flavida]
MTRTTHGPPHGRRTPGAAAHGARGGSGLSLPRLLASVAAAVPDRPAVVAGPRRTDYAGLDERATRLARHLRAAGIRPGEHVAILAYNRAEWLESAFGVWRAGAVPVNVNYRYVPAELRQVLADADAVALIAERSLSRGVAAVRAELPRLRHVLLIEDADGGAGGGADGGLGGLPATGGGGGVGGGTDDGAGASGGAPLPGADYEAALAAHDPDPDGLPATGGDDLYLIYTGGTTGDPKGVMWRQEDIFHAALERRRPGEPRARSAAWAGERALSCEAHRMLVLGPLMHAAGQWNALSLLFNGKTVVLNTDRTFDPGRVADLADREGVHAVQLVGDAMARPLAERLGPSPDRCAPLAVVRSGGTPLTPAVRDLWRSWRPGIVIADSYGGSETGVCGTSADSEGTDTRRFTVGASVAVLDGALRPLPPGAADIGRIARSGRIPLGYYNDPVKTALTFPTGPDGRRWVMSGDLGTVGPDGSVLLLGRGASVINTGGEKVYPEEVERILKSHPEVTDSIVVAGPDERLGQQVTALVSCADGAAASDEQIRAFCRARLAGFKVPRTIHRVDRIRRTAAGKQDYRWAAAAARDAVSAKRAMRAEPDDRYRL